MRYYLTPDCAPKRLETPSVYNIRLDELYEVDDEAFAFLLQCSSAGGAALPSGNRDFVDYCLGEGIVTSERPGAPRPQPEPSPVPSLRYLELQITRRCNLRCRHCYIGPPQQVELTPRQVSQVLSEFEQMQGLRAIITGGEPLMHRDFSEINTMLSGPALRAVLVTNGTLLNPEILDSLNFHEIQVSVDGMKDSHEALRGKGTYEKAINCIETAVRKGFDVSVATMVHAGNLDEFDSMQEMFRSMGVKAWAVDVPCQEGYLKENRDFQLAPEEAGRFMGYGWGEGLHGGGDSLHACGYHLMSVMADGGCARCAFYAGSPVGHISEGLRACWSKIRPLRLRQLRCECDLLELCRGGCRYRAELLGDPLGRDFYRCAFYDRLG